MKISPVKYTRDFYPEDMRVRDWIEATWRKVSENAGFQAWDAPILEHLDLYTRKSGEEIVSQLYTLTDRGDRQLAIRPEMTPSLARMVAQRQGALPRPLKWYCMARMCRYERGQRGRLREFFQWNIDILGVSELVADAEVMSVALDALAAFGLGPDKVELRYNSRSFLASILKAMGVPEERSADIYAVLDKRGKVPSETLLEMYEKLGLDQQVLDHMLGLMQCHTLHEIETFTQAHGITGHEEELQKLFRLQELLGALGKGSYSRFDMGIVRGLAYYTGPVFEIFDKQATLRALCGGGRYDNLLELMGAQPMPAVGFGLGDVVLTELLKDHQITPPGDTGLDYHVISLEEERFVDALQICQSLRSRGISADYAMKIGSLGKAMKRAGDTGVKRVLIVGGREWTEGQVRMRDMKTGEEFLLRTTDIETLGM